MGAEKVRENLRTSGPPLYWKEGALSISFRSESWMPTLPSSNEGKFDRLIETDVDPRHGIQIFLYIFQSKQINLALEREILLYI